MMKYSQNTNERGAVFFYILLAIALFATLTYALNRNSGGSTDMMTEQQAKLAAQEIIEYGETVANAVQTLRLRGCTDINISFYSPSNIDLANYLYSTPVDDTCRVFNQSGGNINYNKPADNWLDESFNAHSHYGPWRFTGRTEINGLGDDSNAELSMVLPFASPQICEEINKILGLPNIMPESDFHWSSPFKGTYGISIAVNEASLIGKTSGCHKTMPVNAYKYIQVLIAR